MDSGPSHGDVTLLLQRWQTGDASAESPLLAAVYRELRRLAGMLVNSEARTGKVQPTELVHEVYLKLVGSSLPDFDDRRHFFRVAARAMRQLLVDHSRHSGRFKRCDSALLVPLEEALATPLTHADEQVQAVNLALDRLAVEHPDFAAIVELRYFGGYTLEQSAEVLGVSRATAARRWALARALLHELLS